MNHIKYLLLVLISTLILSGCQGSNVKKVISHQQDQDLSQYGGSFLLDITDLSEVNVGLTVLGYDGDAIAQSMTQAGYNTPPGADPAAMAIGSLIAGALIKDMQVSAAIDKKNERVEPFLQKAESVSWHAIVTENTALKKQWSIRNEDSMLQNGITVVKPKLWLSADYRNLELISLVSINLDNGKVLYQNYFHVHSKPFFDKTKLLSELNNLTKEQIEAELENLVAQLEILIDKDLSSWQSLPKQNNAIKFVSDDKRYYERGMVLEKNSEFIIYRNLRGEIKRLPVDKITR